MEKNLIETECTALECLFHQVIGNMKMSFPAWEDLTGKALKLNTVLRTTVSATSAFLDALQRVSNLALGSRGATSDIGSTLIRLCLRQRVIEDKLKLFAGSVIESLVSPIQDHLEDWKKTVVALDKDHAKESKKAHQDIKKAYTETVRLRKKSKKGKAEITKHLDHALSEYNKKCEALEAVEKTAVRTALVEEHNRFCYFVQCLKPLVDCELAILAEMTHIEQLIAILQAQASTPFQLPDTGDCVMHDVRKGVSDSANKIPLEESPGGSRKSSVSSASSSCIHSPSHVSMSGSIQNSGERNSEIRDGTDPVSKSYVPTVSLPLQTSSAGCQAPARTLPRNSALHELPPIVAESHSSPEHHQIQRESLFSKEPTATNPYAVPCLPGFEKGESVECTFGTDGYAKTNLINEQEVMLNSGLMLGMSEEIKKVTVVPLEGYVNMNQLACLAVQQQELNLKKEYMDNTDKIASTDMLPLPPPLESPDGTAGIMRETFQVAAGVKRTTSSRFSRTAEDVLLAGASQRFAYGTATIRRGPMRDRSLPPVSRKPTKTATLPLRTDSSRMYQISHQAMGNRKLTEQTFDSRINALPLPPPPPDTIRAFAVDDSSFDDLPLPPPPDELVTMYPQSSLRKSGSTDEIISNRRHASVVSNHAGIIESLNVKFSERRTLPREAAAANFIRGRRASDAMCIEDAKPANEPLSPDSFTATIQRGVQLRRTMTNDRSAPRLPSCHS